MRSNVDATSVVPSPSTAAAAYRVPGCRPHHDAFTVVVPSIRAG
jgi:hypothetical protein